MNLAHFRLFSTAAMAGSLALVTAPATAADGGDVDVRPALAVQSGVVSAAASDSDPWWRRHRHRHYHPRYRRGIDVGDVITGVLILGALATILDAGDDDDDYRRRERDRDWDLERDWRDSDHRDGDYESDGVSNAVDMCLDQVERGETRVEEVTEASRVADGWRVSGTLTRGWGWSCWIDNDGRIRNIDFDTGALSGVSDDYVQDNYLPRANGQWSDADYARARATARTPVDEGYTYPGSDARRPADYPEAPQPPYPGGPLPNDEAYAEIDGDLD